VNRDLRTTSLVLIALAIISPTVMFLPVRGVLCTSPTPMCGGGGGSTYFTVEAIPTDLQVAGGSQGMSSIIVTSVGCFVGTVSLNARLWPSASLPTFWLNPTSISLSCNGSARSTFYVSAVNTPGGVYTFAVSGTSGSTVSPEASISVNVPFPSDPLYANQWGPSDLNLPSAWAKTLGTHNRIIAIVDSGVWFDHPDLQANLWTASDGSHGINFVSVGVYGYPQCISTSNNAADDYGHGTVVAGIVAAVTNNAVGVAGTAQEKVMSVKAVDSGGSWKDAWVGCGIRWAVDHGANVINLSLGGPGTESQYPNTMDAIQYAWNQGALIVASAGNEGLNAVDCPACDSRVVAVSALMEGDTGLDPYSNFGSKVELSAPGNHVLSTFWTGAAFSTKWDSSCFVQQVAQSYCYNSGTSFAAPFVTGIAALAWDYEIQHGASTLSNQQIRSAMDAYTVALSCSNCMPKPDALSLLNNVVSTHTYLLTAHWQYFSSSGTEGVAQVYVYDAYTAQVLSGWQYVGTGLTLNVMPGHSLDVQYNGCFNDGSNTVKLDHVNSVRGPPSGSVSLTAPFTWTMGAVPASTDAVYNIVFLGC